MKKNLFTPLMLGALVATFSLASCSKDDNSGNNGAGDADRWITVSGAVDDPGNTELGDGNLGTRVFSLSAADAKNPAVSVDAFANGMTVKSIKPR